VTYPNVLVLNYLQQTGQDSPEIQMTAEKYVALGYQRLLTFEVAGGGFSLFGEAPADVFLTAYGLMEFTDMAKVYPVDDALLARTAEWLLAQQRADGAWEDQGYSEHWQIDSKVPTTAYIAWSLIDAGYKDRPEVQRAIDYVREFAVQAEDPYALALVANALTSYDPQDPSTQAILKQLYDKRVEEGGVVYWNAQTASFMGGTGQSGSIETTALAAMAMLRADAYPDAVSGALAYLAQSKDSWGTWSTTQATILSLKAFLLANTKGGQAAGPATVRISLNQEQTQEIAIDEQNADVVHVVTFDGGFSPTGDNRVQIELQGGGNLMYQVATRYYLPWDKVPDVPAGQEPITIDLQYDRTALAVNDTVVASVEVKLNVPGVVKMALVDLGVPPGFSVQTEDLDRLVELKAISRYELTGRQIILYIENLTQESPLRFEYRLQARFPLRAQTPPTAAYDYYNPINGTVQAPTAMVVTP
jgi:hypothetical protein